MTLSLTGTEINLALEDECPQVISTAPAKGIRLLDAAVLLLGISTGLLGQSQQGHAQF